MTDCDVRFIIIIIIIIIIIKAFWYTNVVLEVCSESRSQILHSNH